MKIGNGRETLGARPLGCRTGPMSLSLRFSLATVGCVCFCLKAALPTRRLSWRGFLLLAIGFLGFCGPSGCSTPARKSIESTKAKPPEVPTFEEMVKSKIDLWGEAAMRQPNGASYEFFAPLLPPPRYVNADFHYYPVVLSAPNARGKARLISNGSGVNLRGGSRSWQDNGTPVTFRVGPDELIFGSIRERLKEPELAEGYLPIPEIRYLHSSPVQSEGMVPIDQHKNELQKIPEVYRLESFASIDPALADNGVVFVQFSLAQGEKGIITSQIDQTVPIKVADGKVIDEQGRIIAL